MTLSALSKKIEKVENEINKHQEIISDKKKELAELKKQQRTLQLQEKQKRGENFISTLEEKLGTTLVISVKAQLCGALGAALFAMDMVQK